MFSNRIKFQLAIDRTLIYLIVLLFLEQESRASNIPTTKTTTKTTTTATTTTTAKMSRKHRELLYHALAFAFFSYTDLTSISIPGHNNTYGGRYKFLTVLNLKLLILYYGWSTVIDMTYIFWSGVSECSKVSNSISLSTQIEWRFSFFSFLIDYIRSCP